MELDEARESWRALVVEGADSPGKSQRLEEIERVIDKLEEEVRGRKDPAHDRTHVKLMRYDLDVDKDSLRWLVRRAWLLWRVAMDDYEMRHDPDKPKPRLSDNWSPTDTVYDYGDDTGAGLEDWDEWWRQVYHTPAGRRWPAAIPRVPLYGVFYLARAWWFKNTDKRTFGLTYDAPNYTAAERFFLGIAQTLDERYTAKDCAIVYENCRR